MVVIFLPIFLLFLGMGFRSGATTAVVEPVAPETVSVVSLSKTYEVGELKTSTMNQDPFFVSVNVVLYYNSDDESRLLPELKEKKQAIKDIILGMINSKPKEEMDTSKEQEELANTAKETINKVLQKGQITEVRWANFELK